MSHLEYSAYPGFGTHAAANTHYSQTVRVGDIIKVAGQGGWIHSSSPPAFPPNASVSSEIERAFSNVQTALVHAGSAGWAQVYALRVYVTELSDEMSAGIIGELRKWCPGHRPVMTVVEVKGLFADMRIEIEVEAHLGG
ncbi:YjgF-like protein [Pseudovirgaria hyperparasitica]|uniref:YjgF-like protein n=1 Tax=Pseudovirgaria hyperparasitica TaxID=470096 RepID=A0A6A6VST5_9PEZI|nr:YjgF-like protein [Pseudovirgaria hyperparasitica]KAF2752846.1 YjgF-like protein [Pseudovirgaria hyperparasitica]